MPKNSFIPKEEWYVLFPNKFLDNQQYKSLKPSTKIVLQDLIRYGRNRKEFYRTQESISENTGIKSRTTINAAMQELIDRGFITLVGKEHTHGNSSLYLHNVYMLSDWTSSMLKRKGYK